MEQRQIYQAITKADDRCKNLVLFDSRFCNAHNNRTVQLLSRTKGAGDEKINAWEFERKPVSQEWKGDT